jgi:hypothetical protein
LGCDLSGNDGLFHSPAEHKVVQCLYYLVLETLGCGVLLFVLLLLSSCTFCLSGLVFGTMEIPKELLPYLLGQKKDDSSLQESLFRISITFAVLVTVSTTLRLWVRVRMIRNVGSDDSMLFRECAVLIMLTVNSIDDNCMHLCFTSIDFMSHRPTLWSRTTHLESHARPYQDPRTHTTNHQVTIRCLPFIRSRDRLCQVLDYRDLFSNILRRITTKSFHSSWCCCASVADMQHLCGHLHLRTCAGSMEV